MKVHISTRGQVTIPAALRRKYGIKNGTKIIITDMGDAIVIKPVTEQYLRILQGPLKGKGGLRLLLEERLREHEESPEISLHSSDKGRSCS